MPHLCRVLYGISCAFHSHLRDFLVARFIFNSQETLRRLRVLCGSISDLLSRSTIYPCNRVFFLILPKLAIYIYLSRKGISYSVANQFSNPLQALVQVTFIQPPRLSLSLSLSLCLSVGVVTEVRGRTRDFRGTCLEIQLAWPHGRG